MQAGHRPCCLFDADMGLPVCPSHPAARLAAQGLCVQYLSTREPPVLGLAGRVCRVDPEVCSGGEGHGALLRDIAIQSPRKRRGILFAIARIQLRGLGAVVGGSTRPRPAVAGVSFCIRCRHRDRALRTRSDTPRAGRFKTLASLSRHAAVTPLSRPRQSLRKTTSALVLR